MPVCYRHSSRETGVSCSNCGRPICPDCMTPTSVGMRCPECASDRTKVHSMPRRAPGATAFSDAVLHDPRTWSVTHILIFINVAVFLWEVAGGVSLSGNSAGGYAYNQGALFGPLLSHGYHQYWRLLTSGFIHASIFHIGMNMLSLWFVGRSLEPAIGKMYFTAVYFTSLLAGSFGVLLLTPDSPALGASGAIFGVFGALIMLAQARRIPLWQSGLLPMLIFNLVFTLTIPGVSIGAQGGGLVAGLLTGKLVVEYGEKRNRRDLVLGACVAIAVISVIGAIAVAGGQGLLPNGATI
jgi:membrane associated rhomboid family serine protease